VHAIANGEDRRALHRVGRYEIFDRIAAGGMATVHLARLSGAEGFSRVVAVKRMHPHFLLDPEFKAMFVAESRVAARVRHPNVVPILDVLAENDELVIVMDYVHGESAMALARAARQASSKVPVEVAVSILVGVLHGLHAAHTAKDEQGRPLGIVHRDVSSHNVLVGADGIARVLDFGIAKARQGQADTDPGVIKGKYSYMAPELIGGAPATPQSDVFSAAVVAFELLTGSKLFSGANEQERAMRVLRGNYPSVRTKAPHVPAEVERIVKRGLELDPARRYPDARAMALELERAVTIASPHVVGEWMQGLVAPVLLQRSELIQQIETTTVGVLRRSFAPPAGESSPAANSPPAAGSAAKASEASGFHVAPKRQKTLLMAAGIVALGLAALGLALALRAPSPPAPAPAAAQVPAPRTTPAPPATPAPPTATAEKPAVAAVPAATASAAESPTPAPPVSKSNRPGPRKTGRPSKTYLPNEL
jgi:serine/threonine-protein kinase